MLVIKYFTKQMIMHPYNSFIIFSVPVIIWRLTLDARAGGSRAGKFNQQHFSIDKYSVMVIEMQ